MATKGSQLQIRVTHAEKRQIRELARRANVSVSEWVLGRALSESNSRFQEITDELSRSRTPGVVLAQLNDFLTALPVAQFGDALQVRFPKNLSQLLKNQVAAMVEEAAYQRNAEAPSWVNEIEPLLDPYFASDLASLRLHLLTVSPPAYRKRNLFVDAGIGDRI